MKRLLAVAAILLGLSAPFAAASPPVAVSAVTFDTNAEALAFLSQIGGATAGALTAETTRAEAAEATNAAALAALSSGPGAALTAAAIGVTVPSQGSFAALQASVTANTASLTTLGGTGPGGALTNAAIGVTVPSQGSFAALQTTVTANGTAITALQAAAATSGSTPLGAILNQFPEPSATGTGLLIRLPFTGSGTTLTDVSGTTPAGLPFGGLTSPPTRNADGSVSWTSGNSAIPMPSTDVGVKTINFAIQSAVALPSPVGAAMPANTPIGWAAGSGAGFAAAFTQNYNGTSSGQGYGETNPELFQSGGGSSYFSGAGLDNGLHYFTATLNPTGKIAQLWEDGLLLPSSSTGIGFNTFGQNWIPTIGGSPGCGTPANCTFTGAMQFYDNSSTVYTPVQIVQQYHAEQALLAWRGVISSPAYGPTDTNLIATFAESTGTAHGLGNGNTGANPNLYYGTENFSALAAVNLNSVYGDTWTGLAIGGDNATGYTEMQGCPTDLTALGTANGGYRVAIEWTHGNSMGAADGSNPGVAYWPAPNNDTSPYSQTMGDLTGFSSCLAQAARNGVPWNGIVATDIGNASGVYYAVHQFIANPEIRTYGAANGLEVWDPAGDIRFGININTTATGGAGYYNTVQCTLPGGSPGPTYQTVDHLHPTLCGQTILANQLTAVVADMKQKFAPEFASVAATYPMGVKDIDAYLTTPGGGTLTLMPVGGLYNARLVTITNSGTQAETIQAGTEYDGGQVDVIYGDNGASGATYSLAPGVTKTFRAEFPAGMDGTAAGVTRVVVTG